MRVRRSELSCSLLLQSAVSRWMTSALPRKAIPQARTADARNDGQLNRRANRWPRDRAHEAGSADLSPDRLHQGAARRLLRARRSRPAATPPAEAADRTLLSRRGDLGSG